ncbi:hypothetical protein BGY98DRAFT_1188460 [Russula aff. rugulosa BPL654]|nr:hypothetical protein BGY98DRAFT_1188460 [Russula aff. rugulosa BPL654]
MAGSLCSARFHLEEIPKLITQQSGLRAKDDRHIRNAELNDPESLRPKLSPRPTVYYEEGPFDAPRPGPYLTLPLRRLHDRLAHQGQTSPSSGHGESSRTKYLVQIGSHLQTAGPAGLDKDPTSRSSAHSLSPSSAIDIVIRHRLYAVTTPLAQGLQVFLPLDSSFDVGNRNTDETQSEDGFDNDNDADRLPGAAVADPDATCGSTFSLSKFQPFPTSRPALPNASVPSQQWGQRRLPTNELELEQQAECDLHGPDRGPLPSQRDSGVSSCWNAAKNCLTPTKEPLIAAQQVVQETKEKVNREKEFKKVEKERKSSADWSAVPENKFNNPRQRARSSLHRRLLRLGLKSFHQFSLLVWHQPPSSR